MKEVRIIYVPKWVKSSELLSVWSSSKETLMLNYALDIREGHIEIVTFKEVKK